MELGWTVLLFIAIFLEVVRSAGALQEDCQTVLCPNRADVTQGGVHTFADGPAG